MRSIMEGRGLNVARNADDGQTDQGRENGDAQAGFAF